MFVPPMASTTMKALEEWYYEGGSLYLVSDLLQTKAQTLPNFFISCGFSLPNGRPDLTYDFQHIVNSLLLYLSMRSIKIS